MIRLPVAAITAGLLCSVAGIAVAEDPKPAAASPQTQKINEFIAKGWETAGIKKPAEKANDFEFMRRCFIDLIGRIPTPEEIKDFEADHSLNKRARLVSRLLNETGYKIKAGGKALTAIPGIEVGKDGIDYNDAYAKNFADLWTNWMLTRSNTNQAYRDQFHFWLYSAFINNGLIRKDNGKKEDYPNGAPWDKIVYNLISATGQSNDNGAVVFVIRHLGEPIAAESKQVPDFNKEGKFDAVPITSRVTKLFLGIQSQCTQCHDHPFNKEYIQSDFWGVNAFFRQTDRSGTTNPNARNLMGTTPAPVKLLDVTGWNNTGMVLYERRDGQRRATYPAMLKDIEQAQKGENSTKKLVSGSLPAGMEGKTRREILAQWVIEHDNFGKAFVNRMWGHLFGRGLNKEPTVDDFSSNNEVVHPELLDYLAEEYKKYNYDPKKLLEWICTSDAYQLSHVANKAYTDQKYDPYFARMPLKAMSPEVLFESLSVATHARSHHASIEAYKAAKNAWMGKLTQNFGDDEGNEISFNGTVVQALLMMNGKELNSELGSASAKPNPKNAKGPNQASDGGIVPEVMSRHGGSPSAIYDELFLMTVGRRATPAEKGKLEYVRSGQDSVKLGPSAPPAKGPNGKNPPKNQPGVQAPVMGALPYDAAFYQDVLWALLNSNEFILNH